jgi:BASS family bile acid:Na+ symporter
VVLTGLLAPLVLLPALAVGLSVLIPVTPAATAGLLLMAACPIGGMSNVFSYLARASPALSVTLTSLSCLCALVTIPAVSAGLELVLERSLGLSAPVSVVARQFLVVIGAPLAVGAGIRWRWPALADRLRPLLQRLSFAGVTVVLLLVIADDVEAFTADLVETVPLAVLFVAGSWLLGWVTASFVTDDLRDRFTISLEFGTRHVGVATAVAVTVLGRVEFARFGATYFMTEVPLMLVAVALFRRYHTGSAAARVPAAGSAIGV